MFCPAFLLLDEVVFRVSGSGRTVSSCSDQREELCSPPVGSGMCDPAADGLPATWGPSPGLCGPCQRHGRALRCPRAQGELVGEGGTCFGGSTALCRFLRRVGGVRLQVYISDPSTHSRGRLSLVVEGTLSPAWPAVLLRAFPGMPRPLGSCLLYLAHPISSLAVPAFPTLDLLSWFSASLFSDWATPRTLTTSLSQSDSA